jgi:hypothetical protein
VPGVPIWPVISDSAIRQRRIVGAVHVLRDAHPQRIIEPFDVANSARDSRIVCAGMPQIGAIFSGRVVLRVFLQRFEAAGPVLDERIH